MASAAQERSAPRGAPPAAAIIAPVFPSQEASAPEMAPPRTIAVPLTLANEVAAQLAEEIALRQMGRAGELGLTDQQWSDFAAIAAHYQAVRQAYEATLATVKTLERGRYRLEIPAYPAAGDALRATLHADLRAALGESTADYVMRQLGENLHAHFGGFGLSVQTLDFTADAAGAEAEYQVTRTVQYWRSGETSDRFTARRETHFPGLEDPTGHTWGPFLARLAEGVSSPAGS